MIITKTPLRISFVGGGSDLPAFCDNNVGAVVSLAINKYVYVVLNPRFEDDIRVSYSRTEIVSRPEDLKHELIKAILVRSRFRRGVEIVTVADIPGRGSGLGSSSALTVGAILALNPALERDKELLAKAACLVEISDCGKPIGRQDQYASAFGGLNKFTFNKEYVDVYPIPASRYFLEYLCAHLLLVHLGDSPPSANILTSQSDNLLSTKGDFFKTTEAMVALAHNLRINLRDEKIDEFGEILHEGWMLKKKMASSISNSKIDSYYEKAMNAGAEGGKVLGAGGGGFMLFFVRPELRERVIAEVGLRPLKFGADLDGSRVIA